MNTATPYSYARGVHNTRVQASADDATLAELRDRFHTPVALPVRASEYHESTRQVRGDIKKALPYFVGGEVQGKRHDENVLSRTLLTLDIEAPSPRKLETPLQREKREALGQPPQPEEVFNTLETFGFEGWVYTSLSHTKAKPRYRVVLPLQKPITGKALTEDTLKATTKAAATVLGIDAWCTPESWVLSQPMYLPARLKGGPFYEAYTAGMAWRTVGAGEERKDGPADIPDTPIDPVLAALQRAGLYLQEDPGHKGKHYIRCPMADRHGAINDTQTVYFEAHHDGNPRPSVKCFDTEPDEDGKPHLTYRTLVNWLREQGWLTSKDENPDTATALEDYDTFMHNAGVGKFLQKQPEEREFAWERFAPVGKVTVLAGPGGVSKSMLMLHLLAYGAMGQSWAGFNVGGPMRGMYVSYEDDNLELHKRVHRLSSSLKQADDGVGDLLYDVDGALQRNLLLYAADDNAMAWLLMTKTDQRSAAERTARVEWLVGFVRHANIKVIVLDPVVYTHNLEESSPGDMAVYMQTLNYIAKHGGCAVVVLHHMHKTAQWATLEDINQGSLRGASSFADNSRSVAVLVSMPPKDAPRYGIHAEDAHKYAFFKHVKHNYSAPMDPVIFQRSGALLLPRTDIAPLSVEEAKERQEEARSKAKAKLLDTKAFTLLGWLLEHPGATVNMAREGTGIRFTTMKETMKYAMDMGWLEEDHGLNRSKLYTVTVDGKAWFKGVEKERLADKKLAEKRVSTR